MSNECLVCSEPMSIAADILAGEILACGACGQEHELLMPDGQHKLALAPEIEEDWGE
ncbi:lysine biosynthesis protein LysW [Chitinimonas arctica]|uniref:Lysine biosynthesis protein LysW n=1 Tax=Chitinimonas arctica TaxID=2594795 RepID=A0A516SBG1_9NEIS|nr:lysine biosynthesis protein LysW [Chitinimonas arctica]QDQ25480.1 lysine biosynthesis protein LysW [Chitinimonas arctica]